MVPQPPREWRPPIALFVVTGLLVLGIALSTWLQLSSLRRQERAKAEAQLAAIGELKVSQLALWRRERLADAATFRRLPTFSNLLRRVLEGAPVPGIQSAIQRWLEEQGQFDQARLLDAQGRERMAVPAGVPPMSEAMHQDAMLALASGQPVFHDFYRSPVDRKIHLKLLVPVPDDRNPGRSLGLLALRIDPNRSLYPYILHWPTPSTSAETLLVRREGREVLFLNELRFRPDSALALRIPLDEAESPAAMAVRGRVGVLEGLDYRHVPVLADVRPIPDSPWFQVTRMDRTEVFAGYRASVRGSVLLAITLSLAVLAGATALGRNRRVNYFRERYQAESALRASEFRFRHAVEQVPFPMMIHAEDGEVVLLSRTWTELSGYTHEDIPTLAAWTEKAYGPHSDLVLAEITAFYDVPSRKAEGEYAILCRDGSTRVWDFSSVSLGRLPDGRRIAMSMAHDVTERKRVEEELRESRGTLNLVVDTVPQAIFWKDLEGRYLGCNQVFAEAAGLDHPDRILGKTDFELPWLQEEAEAYRADDLEVLERNRPKLDILEHLQRADGRQIWIKTSKAPLPDANGRAMGVLGIFEDITERKQMEEALRISEERFHGFFLASPVGLNIFDAEGKVIAVNSVARRYFGVSEDDPLLGYRLFEDPSISDESKWKVRHGLVAEEDRPIDFSAIKGHGMYRTSRNERDEVFIRITYAPFGSDLDHPAGYIAIIQDITARREAEEEKVRLHAQLMQAQKMESLGSLAGGVAHDMNNVLGAILGMATAHIQAQPLDTPGYRACDTIIQAATRGGKLVKSLLSFARQSPAEEREVDLNEVLREESRMLERTTLAKIRLEMDLAADLRPIRGDASALTHAVMNLCVNAVDAMPEHGTLTLLTRNVDSDWIEVRVEDTGTGMPPEVLAKALDPFFTTKEIGKGTGLGLSMVYRTVKAHQGQLEIQSEPGQGTRITMRFPACEAEPQAPEPLAGPSTAASRPGLNVLVVDDDELLQCTTKALLELLGHRATVVSCGEEALAKLASGFLPDAVILDMNMPGLGGAGTLPRLRALNATLPVLLATGRVDESASDLVAAYPHVTLLSKPYSVEELQQDLARLGRG